MIVQYYYAAWIGIAIAVFLTRRRDAFWIVLFGGWLVLPPSLYAAPGDPLVFPFWLVGAGVPSDLLLSKAWTAPAIAACCSLAFDFKRWRRWRFHWGDAALLLFCLWPLGQAIFIAQPSPAPPVATLYLLGVWGLPWLLGRIYLFGPEDFQLFARTFVSLSLLLLPVAIVEGFSSWRLHGWLFGVHPFAFDGADRYLGYRPQALFEHGNQYGLWCAAATLAGGWLVREARPNTRDMLTWRAATFTLAAMTLASQSAGAILLALAGGTLIALPSLTRVLRYAAPAALAAAFLAGGLHLSGTVPLRSVEQSGVGQSMKAALRAAGRDSFAWRIGRDLRALPTLRQELVTGSGRWNWFAPINSRPWGLPLLLIGQFGLVGTMLAAIAYGRSLRAAIRAAAEDHPAALLALVLLILFSIDALLNSFLLYPAMIVAGAAGFRRDPARQGSVTATPG